MKFVKTLLLFFTVLAFGQIHAQDIHWTMFDMSPLTLNPANTGAYEGTFRVGGIYRSQWNSVSQSTGFSTPSLYIDANILPIGKKSWLAVGGVLYNDEAGTSELNTLGTLGSAAIHIGLNKKATSIFTIGIQGGMIQKRFKTSNLTFQDEQNGEILEAINSQNYPFIGNGNDPEENFLDFSGGVKLASKINKTTDITVGLSFRHITTPTYKLATNTPGDQDDLPLLFTLHGNFNTKLNDKFSLAPAFVFQKLSTANEIGIQALVGYSLGEKKDMTLYLGPGYRVIGNDAVEAILRFDYKQFKVGAAYDFNISDLSAITNGQGGFEVAVSYIARIFKKPTVKPVIFCPRF